VSRRFGIDFVEPEPVPTPAELVPAFVEAPGLYLHVPFCRTICPFCPYNKVLYDRDLAASYAAGLAREVAAYTEVLPGPFPSLYVGGGTPTLLLDELGSLLASLPITGERAIEVLPSHMTGDVADRLAELGFDYVSLGVQSFDVGVLRRLQRPGSPASNRAAIETALGTFEVIDVDLIFDAAFDDPQVLIDDLTTCFGYGVDQVSTYPLMRFGFTPFGEGRHDRRREHELLHVATDLARSHGYERRSVWTFNRMDSPTYTSITRPYFLGMGAGAATFAGSRFWVNHFGLGQYAAALAAGRLPVARIARLPGPAAAAYRLFWQAYTGSVPVDSGDPLLDHPLAASARAATTLLGWAELTDGVASLTERGYDHYHDLERWVTYHLIEPLWAEMMQEHPPQSA
jgi:coproporphyrinogen III oxidase-like Fe-S oxidoreductase